MLRRIVRALLNLPVWVLLFLIVLSVGRVSSADKPLRIATFAVDATPPVGAPLAYDPMVGVNTELSCRGIVLLGADKPIVLCALDWIGISGDGQRLFRESLAKAAGSSPEYIAVHALHQHDAPRCDFSAEGLLAQHGHGGIGFDPIHARGVIALAAAAVKTAVENATEVTHIGLGEGTVKDVASNRRILGEDGKVKVTRWTANRDPAIRAYPVGTIDPKVKLIAMFNGDKPLAALTYYACHPQSYYRTGLASIDFPGLARNSREHQTGVPHIHFNGAGGNIGAGKWNDGSKPNRQVLADKVAAGMKQAWETMGKSPVKASEIAWSVEPVRLPPAAHLNEQQLRDQLIAKDTTDAARFTAAKGLAWLRFCASDDRIPIGCLSLGKARVLHMPGELFVEYQLAAQQLAPDKFVAMAAYGDYSPGYIGTTTAYGQGGYETSARASWVAPEVEGILMNAVNKLLAASE